MKDTHKATTNNDDTRFEHDDPVVDAALDWFMRLQRADNIAVEQAQFEQWLEQDPRHEQEFRQLTEIWGSKSFDRAVLQLKQRMADAQPVPVRQSTTWAIRSMAAAACLLLAAGLWQGPALVIALKADYSTRPGEQSLVHLPDGSSMLLNTDTAVSVDFNDGRRRVQLLKGEAYFDVKHDGAHPFHVAGDYGDVEVKGTAFSVRTDGSETAVVLERGLVDVTCLCTSGGEAELLPGQTVTASADALSKVSQLDPGPALAWRDGRISFNEVQLGHVVSELGRYYRGRVFVASDRVEQLVVSGSYRVDNIEGAIRSLADVSGVKMVRIPGGIIILR